MLEQPSCDPESHRLAYADKGGYIYPLRLLRNGLQPFQPPVVPRTGNACSSWASRASVEEALARMAELDPDDPVDQESPKNEPTWKPSSPSVKVSLTSARRHAELARRKAAEETDPRRKQELLTIASNCEWVPENPPRTCPHEAIQAHWFTQACPPGAEDQLPDPTNGRMDQLFSWPYYQKDLAEGRIDEEGAIELFQCMWASIAQCLDLAITPADEATRQGCSHWEAVSRRVA